ncbi:MAG: FAD-dependent oxidoreductase, partial [Aeromonas sp.]
MRKIGLLALLLGGVALCFSLDLPQALTLSRLQAEQAQLQAWVATDFAHAALSFFALYVLITALSLPGASLLTLAGSALFGLGWGLLLVSFASSLGATLAFLTARYVLRERLTSRFASAFAKLDAGMRRDGNTYLLSLRLIPLVPFFLVNLLMGLTPMRVRDFYALSQLGMLPATLIFVLAGSELGQLAQGQAVLTPPLIAALSLLGLLPLIGRALSYGLRRWQQQRKIYAAFKRPARFDYNLIVIGGGAGGLVSSYMAASLNARVLLIEQGAMGGDCLNHGCVPSKTLIRAARLARDIRDAQALGLHATPSVDFAAVMARVHAVIARIAPHDSRERYRALGVDCLAGHAALTSPWEVEVNGQRFSARHIVLATGAKPFIPAITGLDTAPYFTSDTLWQLTAQPKQLLVLGGGAMGCELAQAFAQLGSQVTLISRSAQLLPEESAEIAATLQAALAADGVRVLTGYQVCAVRYAEQHHLMLHDAQGHTLNITGDQLLLALGRRANVANLSLDALGIELTSAGQIAVDSQQRTRVPNIFAVGDVASRQMLTNAAGAQGAQAALSALLGPFWRGRRATRQPYTVYTTPEIARVGLDSRQAAAQAIAVDMTRFSLSALDRAACEGREQGWVEV